ncbi:MAG: hypothetical protein ACO3EZ_14445 [Prochlorotrichaceae cyanobacterium]
MFLTNQSGANDPILQAAMAAYAKRVLAEEQRRQEVRQGIRPPLPPTGVWNISDRD